jgi:hypothetical protein
VDDLFDQLERVLGALAQADERNVGMLGPRSLRDLCDIQLERDDLVSEGPAISEMVSARWGSWFATRMRRCP